MSLFHRSTHGAAKTRAAAPLVRVAPASGRAVADALIAEGQHAEGTDRHTDAEASYRRFGTALASLEQRRQWPVRDPARRIRVGHVSGDFKASPVAWFVDPVLDCHDRAAFAFFCCSNVARDGEVTARILHASPRPTP